MKNLLKLFGAMTALTAYCSGISPPGPDLAQAIQASDTIVVGRIISGKARSDNASASAELVVEAVRVLAGDLAPGSQITIKTRGNRRFLPEPTAGAPRNWAVPHFTALWFLHGRSGQYTAIPATPAAGEPERAGLLLPEDSPGAGRSASAARTVGEEVVAALRRLATMPGQELRPIYSRQMIEARFDPDQLTEALATLGDPATLHSIYRELASDRVEALRARGIAGLIAGGDPAGPKQAAAELRELYSSGSAGPIAASLAGYLNPVDSEAVLAVGRLATENQDLDIPALRKSAAQALTAIHSRDAMPALIALLDSRDAAVGGQALNGICLFVRNAPLVTAQSIPSGAWRRSREPAPFRTAQTDAYCWMNPLPASWAPPEYIAFWKAWWREHAAEVMRTGPHGPPASPASPGAETPRETPRETY